MGTFMFCFCLTLSPAPVSLSLSPNSTLRGFLFTFTCPTNLFNSLFVSSCFFGSFFASQDFSLLLNWSDVHGNRMNPLVNALCLNICFCEFFFVCLCFIDRTITKVELKLKLRLQVCMFVFGSLYELFMC